MAMEGLLTVLKGTDLYDRLEHEGRLRGESTGDNLATQLTFVPEMPAEVLTAGYTRVLNTLYDPRLAHYFARCWTLVQRLDRRRAPTPMATPLRPVELLRFVVASLKQCLSPQGPAYLQFLCRVLTRHPAMLREALGLAAKGYHLRTITEQLTAVEHVKQSLAHAMDTLHADMARRALEGQHRLTAYTGEVITRVRREYGRIHPDFRHEVDDAFTTLLRALDVSLTGFHRRLPRRVSRLPRREAVEGDE